MSFFTTFVRNRAASWRKRPVRSLLFGVILLPHAGYRKISGVASRRLAGDGTAADHVFYGIPSGAMANGPRAKDGKLRIRQQWVPLKRIAPALRQAVVTSEDDLFWKHDGFNFSQMYDALKRNWDKGRMAAGGSTISQQLAKNLWFYARAFYPAEDQGSHHDMASGTRVGQGADS